MKSAKEWSYKFLGPEGFEYWIEAVREEMKTELLSVFAREIRASEQNEAGHRCHKFATSAYIHSVAIIQNFGKTP